MYTKSGIQAYAQVSVESAVLSASPHQLVVLLFDGALSAMKKAMILIEQGDIPGKGQALGKAINIISNGLQSGLNHEVGGELTTNLDSLYDIADAWKEIGPNSQHMRDND